MRPRRRAPVEDLPGHVTQSHLLPDAEPLDPATADALLTAGRSWAKVARATVDPAEAGIDPNLAAVERRGSRGDRYVRVVRSHRQGFERVGPGWLQATRRASVPTSGAGRAWSRARNVLLGRPLSTQQFIHERLTKVKALAVLSSDALSSVAYATEQILAVLALAGVAALTTSLPIMGAIVILLGFVVLSYRQTIKAYPKGGGSYIVAKDNLGALPGLIAAAALMTDYVLTVAVSVASGADQIQGAWEGAAQYRTLLCVGMIGLIMVGNLRGIRESGSIFAAPTYLFIAAMLGMLATIIVRSATGTLHPAAVTAAVHGTESLGLVLVLRAFASGCTALTGVEAISDGVPAFQAPEWRNARRTLTIMGLLLATMFVGITVAASHLDIRPLDPDHPQCEGVGPCRYQSVIAQLAARSFGDGSVLFVVVAAATTLILILAANTSFSDFPRLLSFLARDDYAPHQFRRLGDRLAFSNGIIVLGVLAALLEAVTRANVNALIPLYAVGVFLAFTMSQAGMVMRWLRRREPGWRRGLPLNFTGMCLTAIVFVVFGASKIREGAWVVLLIIPTLVMLFRAIHSHYAEAADDQATELPTAPDAVQPTCVVPIPDLGPIALQSLALARAISKTVIAVHVCDDEQHMATLRAKWDLWGNHVPLVLIESPYRSFIRPLLAYIDALDHQSSHDTLVMVLPELVATRWWHQVLHNQSALRLKAALLFRPGTVVVSVPYHVRRRGKHRVVRNLRARRHPEDPEAL